MADYIDGFNNHNWRHSTLDTLVVTEYETTHTTLLQLACVRSKKWGSHHARPSRVTYLADSVVKFNDLRGAKIVTNQVPTHEAS